MDNKAKGKADDLHDDDMDADHQEKAVKAPKKPVSQGTIIAVVAVLCVVLAAGGYAGSRYTQADLMTALGAALGAGLVAWGILYLALGLKSSKKKSQIALLVLVVPLLATTYYGYTLGQQDAQRARDEAAEAAAAAAAKAAALKAAQQAAKAGPSKDNDPTETERFAAAYLNNLSDLRKAYLRDMEAAGWTKALDADRVRQDKGLADSKVILQKATDLVAQYRAKHHALVDDTLKLIPDAKLTQSAKDVVTHTFDSTSVNSHEKIDALWNFETKLIAETQLVFDLLAAKKGMWSAQNGRILFTTKADLDVFNGHVSVIEELNNGEEAIRKQQQDAVDLLLNASRNDVLKVDAPAADAAAPAAADAPKTDAPKPDAPKADAPKADAAKK
jgi:hypothetical protein